MLNSRYYVVNTSDPLTNWLTSSTGGSGAAAAAAAATQCSRGAPSARLVYMRGAVLNCVHCSPAPIECLLGAASATGGSY